VKCALDGAAKVIVANRTLSRIEPIVNEIRGTKSEFCRSHLPQTRSARSFTRWISW